MTETPKPTRRTNLLLPWLLMVCAGIGTLLVVWATVSYWPSFGVLGKLIAVVANLFAFGALVALTLAFFSSILLPTLRRRRRNDTF